MNATISALFFLRLTIIKNGLVTRIKRLKQPKYLFGGIAGILYFYFLIFRQFRFGGTAATAHATPPSTIVDLYYSSSTTVGALVFTVLALLYWLWPRTRAALTFSEAEIAFLFPAPIARRTLINYRIVNLMMGLLLTAFLFSLISSRSSYLSSNMLMRFIGWWILLFTMTLHSIASSFVITRLLDRGITSLKRQLSVFALVVIAVVAFVLWTRHNMPVASDGELTGVDELKSHFMRLLNTSPLSLLLLPAKLVIAPAVASTWTTFITALCPAILIAALHYLWILKSEVAFEEASLVKAEKRAAKVTAMRAGKFRLGESKQKAAKEPFSLAKVRRPEIAFLWKNLLATAPYLRGRTAWISLLVVVLFCKWLTNGDNEILRSIVLGVTSVIAGYVLFFGPIIARQDLRNDLMNADILKIYPLRGWQVVLGEMLTPVTIVSFIYGLFLLTTSLCLHAEQYRWMTPVIHWSSTLAVAIVGVLLCATQVLFLNAAAILFPGWMQTGQSIGTGGIEVMGQRLLFMAGLILIIALAVLPAALFAALVFFLTKWFTGYVIATALATITVIAILVVEIIFGLEWLGQKFEAFDLSSELRT